MPKILWIDESESSILEKLHEMKYIVHRDEFCDWNKFFEQRNDSEETVNFLDKMARLFIEVHDEIIRNDFIFVNASFFLGLVFVANYFVYETDSEIGERINKIISLMKRLSLCYPIDSQLIMSIQSVSDSIDENKSSPRMMAAEHLKSRFMFIDGNDSSENIVKNILNVISQFVKIKPTR